MQRKPPATVHGMAPSWLTDVFWGRAELHPVAFLTGPACLSASGRCRLQPDPSLTPGTFQPDPEGVALLTEWIASLKP
jgi:hypothetical protein